MTIVLELTMVVVIVWISQWTIMTVAVKTMVMTVMTVMMVMVVTVHDS